MAQEIKKNKGHKVQYITKEGFNTKQVSSYKDIEKLVGGSFEQHKIIENTDCTYVVLLNAEGRINKLPQNENAKAFLPEFGEMFGNVVIAATKPNLGQVDIGEMSLSAVQEMAAQYLKQKNERKLEFFKKMAAVGIKIVHK